MADMKEWPTLLVASAACGVALQEGMNLSNIQAFAGWILNKPVWTHELIHEPTMSAMREVVYEKFPDLPKRNDARADWEKARDAVIDRYGATLLLNQTDFKRQETPEETAKVVAPHASIIPFSKDHTND